MASLLVDANPFELSIVRVAHSQYTHLIKNSCSAGFKNCLTGKLHYIRIPVANQRCYRHLTYYLNVRRYENTGSDTILQIGSHLLLMQQ